MASSKLTRTNGTATNSKIMTFSVWFKIGTQTNQQTLISSVEAASGGSYTDLKIMKVSNKNFKNIELHSMKMTYGVMEMRKLIEPQLGPRTPLVLSPGNDHLMLFGINEKLKSGENLDLTFVFKDGKNNKITKAFKFVVK